MMTVMAGSVALFGLYRSRAALETENRKLAEQLRNAETATAALSAEKHQGTEQLAAAQELSTSLLGKLAAAEAANPKSAPAPEVKAYQVPAYLGQALLGPVWIVPRNVRMDTNTQRYVYENSVVLEERYRGFFVTHYTNIVEREVATTYVDNNYYPTTFYTEPAYYYVPGHSHGSNHFPRPTPLPSPLPPTTPPPPPNVNSGAGKITPQKLMIPADRIKTLPIGR